MANILLIEPNLVSQSSVREILSEHDVRIVSDANTAIEQAAGESPDLVIIEMSLAGHSGMEFLYEFRTYADWRDLPVIVYSSLRLSPEILESRSWKQLGVYHYLYKPEARLAGLADVVEKVLA